MEVTRLHSSTTTIVNKTQGASNNVDSDLIWREKSADFGANLLPQVKSKQQIATIQQHQKPINNKFVSAKLIRLRSIRLTWCVVCFISGLVCLVPFLSLHLTQRVGLLLFESQVLQLRSSFISVIICLVFLVTLDVILIHLHKRKSASSKLIKQRATSSNYRQRNKSGIVLVQQTIRCLACVATIVNVISYLSCALVVPHVRQLHRMPIATFDCQANSIIIENCQQQFATRGQQSIFEAIGLLLAGDLNGNSARLSQRFDCLRYNSRELRHLQVPTRFLLHKCGLVCKPHVQQLHQFGDDLNTNSTLAPTIDNNSAKPHFVDQANKRLKAPYDVTSAGGQFAYDEQQDELFAGESIALKICFSADMTEGSNYKRFCIENLTSGSSTNDQRNPASKQQDQTLTVGQLNAMLRRLTPSATNSNGKPTQWTSNHEDETSTRNIDDRADFAPRDQSDNDFVRLTNYANPFVQFESHFKNWPHLNVATAPTATSQRVKSVASSLGPEYESEAQQWCKFKSIPPFIVNNKPFGDIQCSLKREYTIKTSESERGESVNNEEQHSTSGNQHKSEGDKIYLNRKHEASDGELDTSDWQHERASHRQRCNIQCKVNILYQVHESTTTNGYKSERRPGRPSGEQLDLSASGNLQHLQTDARHRQSYYLPLKPCLIVSGDGDKAKTSLYYLVARTIADSSLLITLVLIDLLLLIESIDTHKFQLEARKLRLFSLLLAIALLPLIVALLFDLAASWLPNYASKSRRDGYLISFVNERLIPWLSEFLAKFESLFAATTTTTTTTANRTIRPIAERESDSLISGLSTLRHNWNYSQAGELVDEPGVPANSSSFIGQQQPSAAQRQMQTSHKRANTGTNQWHVVDNYLVPFIVYAIFMFALVINLFKLPVVGSLGPIVRATSTEQLGMTMDTGCRGQMTSVGTIAPRVKSRKRMSKEQGEGACGNAGAATTSPPDNGANNSPDKRLLESSCGSLMSTFNNSIGASQQSQQTRVVLFAILVLFMGLQFHLSQITQTQILFDSFGAFVAGTPQVEQLQLQQVYKREQNQQLFQDNQLVTFWFVLTTHSSGAIVTFLFVLFFSDEISSFLAEFSPFKPIGHVSQLRQTHNNIEQQQYFGDNLQQQLLTCSKHSSSNFRKYISISLLVYALRFYVLANVSQLSKLKWFLVVSFQLTEMLNFPLTWFVLAARAHELAVASHQHNLVCGATHNSQNPSWLGAKAKTGAETEIEDGRESESETKLFGVHILAQTSLAFVYFAFSRFVALFVHSLHASLHLHSDNIDWFIQSFYPTATPNSVDATNANATTSNVEYDAPKVVSDDDQSLFSPQPSERQTYVHASRLFIKYNSLVCLVVGLYLTVSFAFTKYELWLDQKKAIELRQIELAKAEAAKQKQREDKPAESDCELIDHQLGRDLMRLHAIGTKHVGIKTIHPRPVDVHQRQSDDSALDDEYKPRARVHYKYNLARWQRKPRLHQKQASAKANSSSEDETLTSDSCSAMPGEADGNGVGKKVVETDELQDIESTASDGEQRQINEVRLVGLRRKDKLKLRREEEKEAASSVKSSSNQHEQPDAKMGECEPDEVEQIQRTISKRVRLIEEDENWNVVQANDCGSFVLEPPRGFVTPSPPPVSNWNEHEFAVAPTNSPIPIQFADDDYNCYNGHTFAQQHTPEATAIRGNPTRQHQQRQQTSLQLPHRSKRISFAPTTTLFGYKGERSGSGSSSATNGGPSGSQSAGGEGGNCVRLSACQPGERADNKCASSICQTVPMEAQKYTTNKVNMGKRANGPAPRCASPEPSIGGTDDENVDCG